MNIELNNNEQIKRVKPGILFLEHGFFDLLQFTLKTNDLITNSFNKPNKCTLNTIINNFFIVVKRLSSKNIFCQIKDKVKSYSSFTT